MPPIWSDGGARSSSGASMSVSLLPWQSYAVVKLSDMADLKAKLQKEAKETAKQKLIDELGEDGYAQEMAALKAAKMKEQADLKAAKEKEKAAKEVQKKADKLSSLLSSASKAAEGGISPTLAGATITKTAAKKEWRVKPDEIVGHLKPVDPTKKHPKYYLADVIGVAHNKGASAFRVELESSPDRRKLYARYLVDTFHAECKADEALGDAAIVQKVRFEASDSIEALIRDYGLLITQYRERVVKEKTRLIVLERLWEDAIERGSKIATADQF